MCCHTQLWPCAGHSNNPVIPGRGDAMDLVYLFTSSILDYSQTHVQLVENPQLWDFS